MPNTLPPDFIIIGAMKSGTTTLYQHLARHPEVNMSRDKETDFFVAEKNWALGLDWYAAQFAGSDAVRGEASPNYTKRRDFPGVPERMFDVCPDVRLIYILRDPVDRAESQYNHSVIMGLSPPDLDDFEDSHEYAHILDASLYAHQLDAYAPFFSRDAFLFLEFDELVRDPQTVMNRITDHIGVSRHPIAETGAQNDSEEIARVPAPVLKFAQSPLGRRVAGLVGRDVRNRIRGGLAIGHSRKPHGFPDALRERLARDISKDAARIREITGLACSGWSV